MMKRLLLPLIALAMASCAPAPEQAAEHVLTYASPYPPGHPFSRADIEWMKKVERDSNGRIGFRAYWSGALLSSDMSMEEIRHGVADIGLITPIYARGGAHMLRTQSGFYGGVRDIGEQVAIYDCLAARFPQFARETEGLHILAVQGGNFPGVLTRSRPVRSLADFKGLRLRAPSEVVDVLRDLGADPVNMPMGEVYSALAKGVIDGVVAPADTIRSLHFSEVADYFTPIRFSRGAYPARAISDKAWRRLAPEMQTLLLRSRRLWEQALTSEILKAEAAGVEFGKTHGLKFEPFAADQQARFDRLYNRDALKQAVRLRQLGMEGEPVLAMAQSLISQKARTGAIACDTAATTGNPE